MITHKLEQIITHKLKQIITQIWAGHTAEGTIHSSQ